MDLLGFLEIWSGSGQPRERSNSLLQASGSTPDGPGSGPPKTPGLSRADQSRGEAGGPVSGSPPSLPSPLQESGNPAAGATVPGLPVPIRPSLWGPWPLGLCDHQPTLKSAEANVGETAARHGSDLPLLPPAAGPRPQGPAESSVCSFTELPAPSQLEGSGKPNRPGGLECGQDRAGGARGVVTSTPGREVLPAPRQGRAFLMGALKQRTL